MLVAAGDEELVISRLVANLCSVDYPINRYDVWVIDDAGGNRTAQRLQDLKGLYPNYGYYAVVLRPRGQIRGPQPGLAQYSGEIIGVFDADAQVTPDMLRRVVPMLNPSHVGAVQMQKAIVNQAKNLWTRGQQAEMALDSYFQQQRISLGGLGELRGNGQFVRRAALVQSGG
jgi:1,2-diacylglycerol 3-beta-glucosyltransferase